LFNRTGGAPTWAKAGSWTESNGKIVINASSFDATSFTKFSIAYSLIDLDRSDNAGYKFAKLQPKLNRYTLPANF
jgi:hypothetical protein